MSWSLAVEIQFYALIPWLVRALPLPTLRRVLWTIVATAPAIRLALYAFYPFGGLAAHLLLPARWDALCLGVLGAIAMQEPARVRGAIPGLRATALACCLVISVLIATRQSVGSISLILVGYTSIALLSVCALLLAMVSEGGRVQWWLRRGPLVWLGTISYAVYLVHQPMSGLLHGFWLHQQPRIAMPRDLAVTCAALAATLLLSAILTSWVDEPIRRVGRRLARA